MKERQEKLKKWEGEGGIIAINKKWDTRR